MAVVKCASSLFQEIDTDDSNGIDDEELAMLTLKLRRTLGQPVGCYKVRVRVG